MNHRVTDEIKDIVGELYMLREIVESRLDLASVGAREQWINLKRQIPSLDDVVFGFVAPSRTELEQMRAKIRRFGQILAPPPRSPAQTRRPSRSALPKSSHS